MTACDSFVQSSLYHFRLVKSPSPLNVTMLKSGKRYTRKISPIVQGAIITKMVEPIRVKGKNRIRLKASFEQIRVLYDIGRLLSRYSFCPSIEIEAEVGTTMPRHIEEKQIYIVIKYSDGNDSKEPYTSLAPSDMVIARMMTMIGPISPFIK